MTANQSATPLPTLVRLAHLAPSPTNPRRTFRDESLAEMADSIQRHGVLQPILVRAWPFGQPKPGEDVRYEIVAGERRYRASIMAGIEIIPATIRQLDDVAVLEIQVIENLQREEVHPLEEADGYQLLMERSGYSVEEVATKVGKSKAYVYARLKLRGITGTARERFVAGDMPASVALLIARIPSPEAQAEAAREVVAGHWGEGPMSARDAANHIQTHYMVRLARAPFDTTSSTLLPDVNACTDCPRLSGNAREMFPDVRDADVCTEPRCYARKKSAHVEQQIEVAKAKGLRVLSHQEVAQVLPYPGSSVDRHTDLNGWIQAHKLVWGLNESDGARPTWCELLGTEWAPEAALLDAEHGQISELMQEAQAYEAAARLGHTIHVRQTSTGRDQVAEKLAKQERIYRGKRLLAIMDAVTQGDGLGIEDMRLIARQHYQRLWDEYRKQIAGLLVGARTQEAVHAVTTGIDDGTHHPAAILMACALISEVAPPHSWKLGDEPERIQEVAQRWGLDAAQAEGQAPSTKAKSAIKYRHPDPEHGFTWSGKGKKPRWVEDYLASGGTLDDLEVIA